MDEENEKKDGADVKPVKAKKESTTVDVPLEHDVDGLADVAGLRPWERAGLFKAEGWSPGKRVTVDVFDAAIGFFRERRQGGGRKTA